MIMKMIKKDKFLGSCICKFLNLGTRVLRPATYCNKCFQDSQVWSQVEDEECWLPKDAPRGLLAVYAGEGCKRYVIKVTLLRHLLFKALLDHAEEVFGFTRAPKLRIPCNENIFIGILGRARNPIRIMDFDVAFEVAAI